MDFIDAHVLITGAAQGIGYATARSFLSNGAHVTIVDINLDKLEHARDKLIDELKLDKSRVLALECDVSDEKSVELCFKVLRDSRRSLDVLVNAAGILVVGDISGTSQQDFARVLAVNVTGTFLVMKHARPLLDDSGAGAIVNFSSLAGKVGMKSLSAYCASKAAVISLTHVAAQEFAPEVRVNAVLPGIVDTEMQRREYAILSEQTGQSESEIRQEWERSVPLGRLQEPDEIADTVLYLAGPRARSITGQSLAVNGGLRMD